MDLRQKYDRFYRADSEKEALAEITVRGWPKNRTEAIVAMGTTGDSILDVGCGNGLLLRQFAKNFGRLIGLEYSAARLEQAKVNLANYDFTPILGTAEDMADLESDSVDLIISADVIEHVLDVFRATEELFRVLKPGGTLVINTPNVAFLVKRLRLLAGRFPSTSQPNEGIGSDVLFDGGHLHYFTYRSLGICLDRVGFVPKGRIGFGPFGRVHNWWPSLLSVGVQLIVAKPLR